jgi:hypothetical protein
MLLPKYTAYFNVRKPVFFTQCLFLHVIRTPKLLILLNRVNQFVYVIGKHCVFSEVETEALNYITCKFPKV